MLDELRAGFCGPRRLWSQLTDYIGLRLPPQITSVPSQVSFPLPTSQHKVDRHLRLDLHRFPIQGIGPVAPLSHRLDCRLRQHRMSTYYPQISIIPSLEITARKITCPRMPADFAICG